VRTYISLLRGINVTGHHIVPMAKLTSLYESFGLKSVRTYIQSGNVIFQSDGGSMESVRSRIERGVERSFGFPVTVLLRKPSDLQRIVRDSPFGSKRGVRPDRLYVTFLEAQPGPSLVSDLIPIAAKSEDEYRLMGKEIFLHCPGGYGKTDLSNTFFEKHLKMKATTRNWNTVNRMIAIADEISG